jgi:hypothetical protein
MAARSAAVSRPRIEVASPWTCHQLGIRRGPGNVQIGFSRVDAGNGETQFGELDGE